MSAKDGSEGSEVTLQLMQDTHRTSRYEFRDKVGDLSEAQSQCRPMTRYPKQEKVL